MRILLSVDPFLPVPPTHYGGIERIAALLLAQLRRRGHQIGLVAHPESTATADYFVPWPEIAPATVSAHYRNARTLRNAVGEFRPDLVHSYSRLLYLLRLLPTRLPKIMSYQRQTGGLQTAVAARLGGKSLAFTGCSEFIATMGRAHGGRWHAIPNFVDVDAFRFSPTVAADAPLVFLSRIEPVKGTHIAVEVAKRTGRRIMLAGNHAETGAEGDYWRALIRPELGKNGVEYIGPVDDSAKNRLLGSAAALLVPVQWDEPFGIVFAEALACGTPVISCPRGALPEIIRHGIEGFLVGDIGEASRAVDDVGSLDRAACRARVEQCFSAEAVVPRYEALYDALVECVSPLQSRL
jgi:glycosyltransferase involved in cell wall biosynthesis